MEKRCVKCGIVGPLTEFYRASGTQDGHRNDCKACNAADKARRYRANPEPPRERARQWRRANLDRRAMQRAAEVASGRKQISDRKSHLKRKFGITLEDYERMLGDQGGGCAICGRPPRDGVALHVGHDHETGRVRGLLCFRCNNALGDLEDDPVLLRQAARYLEPVERHPELERRLRELKNVARCRAGSLRA